MITDADRLVWLVRRMSAEEVARVFRDGLQASELMRIITALPTDRLNDLTDRARQPSGEQRAALGPPTVCGGWKPHRATGCGLSPRDG